MPTGVPRTADQILAEIIRLQARYKELSGRGPLRQALLKYCRQHDINRTDLSWVYAQLPPVFITKKRRLGQLKNPTYQQQPPNKPPTVARSRGHTRIRSENQPFADWLKKHRADKKLTVTQVAQAVGSHPSMISLWEKAYWYPSKPQFFERLEKLFGSKVPRQLQLPLVAKSKPKPRPTPEPKPEPVGETTQ